MNITQLPVTHLLGNASIHNYIAQPLSEDILLGRGKGRFLHPGNCHLRSLIQRAKAQYNTLSDKRQKSEFQKQIFNQLPGRFLEKSADGFWLQVPPKRALKKIADDLRSSLQDVRRSNDQPTVHSNQHDNSPHCTDDNQNLYHTLKLQKQNFDLQIPSDPGLFVPILSNFLRATPSQLHPIITHSKNRQSFQQMVSSINDAALCFLKSLHLPDRNSTTGHPSQTNVGHVIDEAADLNSPGNTLDDIIACYTGNSPTSFSSGANTSGCRSPTAECVKGFQRPLFYDEDLVNAYCWNELMSRNLPGKHAYNIISVYAFHCFGIFSLQFLQTKSNKKIRVYKCKTCPADSTTSWTVTASVVNEAFNLWRVQPKTVAVDRRSKLTSTMSNNIINTTDLPCNCLSHNMFIGKRKLSVPLLFNTPLVRRTVFDAYDKSTADVDMMLLEQLEKHFNLDGKNQLPKKKQRLKMISQLQTIKIHLLRREYHFLPHYMEEFANLNPDASVALQSDSSNHFFRLFVAFPIALPEHRSKFTIPVLFIDCCHYQCPQYDGIAITLSSKTGCGLIVILSFAIIPTEDTDSICWFLQLCALHGIDMNCALFTDQGPLLSAVRQLRDKILVKFCLMLCLQHLIRNIRHKFPTLIKYDGTLDKSIIQAHMDEAADSENMVSFFHAIDKMVNGLCQVGADVEIVVDMVFYVLRVHPSHWTVFGNAPSFVHFTYKSTAREFLGRLSAVKLFSENIEQLQNTDSEFDPNLQVLVTVLKSSYREGRSFAASFDSKKIYHNNNLCCPRYNNKRNNAAESLHSLYLQHNLRCKPPAESFRLLLELYNQIISVMMSEANDLKDCSFTTNGHNACNDSLANEIHGELSGPEKHPAFEIYCLTRNDSFETNINILDENNVQSSHKAENVSSSKHDAAVEHASSTMEDPTCLNNPRKLTYKSIPDDKATSSPYHLFLEGVQIQQKSDGNIGNFDGDFPSAVRCFRARGPRKLTTPLFDFTSPLDDSQDCIISNAFSPLIPHDEFRLRYPNAFVQQKDFLTLCQGEWLNDVIIDLFMWVLNEREKKKGSKKSSSYFCCVHFFKVLHSSDKGFYSYKLAKDKLGNDVDIFSLDILFIPVHIPNHWFCIAIYITEKLMVCYDSNGQKHRREDELLLVYRFLVDEHFIQKGQPLSGQWRLQFTHPRTTPQQIDGHNCGVYTIMYADCLSLGYKLDFHHEHVINYRNHMALKILEKRDGSQFPFYSKRTHGRRQRNRITESHIIPPNYLSLTNVCILDWFSTHYCVEATQTREENKAYISFHSSPVEPVVDQVSITIEGGSTTSDRHLIDSNEVESFAGKRFRVRGKFSANTGNYFASLTLSFDERGIPFDVHNECERHVAKTVNQQCPCSCIMKLSECVSRNVRAWPLKEHFSLYPPAYQGKSTHRHCQMIRSLGKTLDVTIPAFDTSRQLPSGPCSDALPKFKHSFGGRR